MENAMREDLTGLVLKEGPNEYLVVEGPAEGWAGGMWTCCEYYAQESDGEVYARGEHADVDAAYLSSLPRAGRAVFSSVRDVSSYETGYIRERGCDVAVDEDADSLDARCRRAAEEARAADRALRSRAA